MLRRVRRNFRNERKLGRRFESYKTPFPLETLETVQDLCDFIFWYSGEKCSEQSLKKQGVACPRDGEGNCFCLRCLNGRDFEMTTWELSQEQISDCIDCVVSDLSSDKDENERDLWCYAQMELSQAFAEKWSDDIYVLDTFQLPIDTAYLECHFDALNDRVQQDIEDLAEKWAKCVVDEVLGDDDDDEDEYEESRRARESRIRRRSRLNYRR